MSDDEQFKYGLSDGDDHEGELILWETTDSTPFTHVAVVMDEAAFDRYIERVRAEQREQIITMVDASPAVTWTGKGGVRERIAAVREASDD